LGYFTVATGSRPPGITTIVITARPTVQWDMTRCSLWRVLLVGVAVAFFPLLSGPAGAAEAGPGVKRALLVGINNYKAVPHLMGSLNDVAAMRQILITRWEFAPENVVTLTDEAATRAGILRALRQLVSESGPDDTVVFHYSGHGSQVKDLNGDEDDGLDETLVPYDGRTQGVPDIVDDELDAIFAKLRTSSALIILDSCHSGTGTRGVEFRARGIEPDMRLDEYQDPAVRPSEAGRTRAVIPRMTARELVMSAVASDQEALDGPIEGEYHGIFTYALSRSLAVSPPGATPRDVFVRVGQELKQLQARLGHTALPDPQLEGPPSLLDRALLVGPTGEGPVSGAPRLAWLDVQPRPAGQVMLIQGALLGAASGSTWMIYPPGETAFAPGRAIAVALVTGSVGVDARATLRPDTLRLEPGSRAVPQMPTSGSARIAVRLLEQSEARRRQLETVLKSTVPHVEFVGADRAARFLIDTTGNTLRLLTSDGRQVLGTFDGRTSQWGAEVARIIARSAAASELLSLDNPAAQIRLQAQVVGGPRPGGRDVVVVAHAQPAQLHIRHSNEPRTARNSLQVSLAVSADAYITIVDVDSEGHANLLFPNSYQRPDFWPEGRVPRDRPLLMPDTLTDGGRAGFFWDYGPPVGMDTVRIFATTDLGTARLIRGRIQALQAGPADGTRGVGSTTPGNATVSEGLRVLREDLSGLATRGIVVTQDFASPVSPGGQDSPQVPGDWAAASLTVAIAE
jgi:hypothetical protein